MLSGAEEGAQGAPFESYKLAASKTLLSRGVIVAAGVLDKRAFADARHNKPGIPKRSAK